MKNIKIIPIKEEASFLININRSTLHIPEWYKKSPQKMKNLEDYLLIPNNPSVTTSTYKKCTPFLDSLTNGYTFSLSQDIEVIKNKDGSPYILWRSSILNPISWHESEQWEGLEHPDNCHRFVYKWENKLIVKTPKNYSTLFTHPHNRFDLPFYTLSGIVDTDKFNQPVNFPFFIKNNFTGIIKAGTPIAQITFFKRNHWFKIVKKYNEKYAKKESFKFFGTIERSYKNLFWEKKIYE